ncbi:hypothetical protein D478_21593 [Brevibacillus agri BAB-2500]|nr:hypothetical protein D478_21593 [Brevibacillus agri BAB-2500]
MDKTLVKEVPFGKGIARITVSMWSTPKYSDGIPLGCDEVHSSSLVVVLMDGKVVSRGFFAEVLEYNFITDTYFHKLNLDPTSKYSRVGDKALTPGAETGEMITSLIKEMKAELAKEFNVETEEEKQRKEEVEYAQGVIALAEKQGVDTLPNSDEVKAWRKRYNDLYNEGGEGYIPVKVSKEQYQWALNVVGRSAV